MVTADHEQANRNARQPDPFGAHAPTGLDAEPFRYQTVSIGNAANASSLDTSGTPSCSA